MGKFWRILTSGFKTKKWTVRAMHHFFDLSISNSWVLYRKDRVSNSFKRKDILDLLEFKMNIAESYIFGNTREFEEEVDEEMVTRSKSNRTPIPSKYKKGNECLPFTWNKSGEKTRSVCRGKNCTKKTKVKCIFCNVYLCLTAERNCFRIFHTEEWVICIFKSTITLEFVFCPFKWTFFSMLKCYGHWNGQ